MKEKTNEPKPVVVIEHSPNNKTLIFMLDEGDSMPMNTSTNYDHRFNGASLVFKRISPSGGRELSEHYVNDFDAWHWIDKLMRLGVKYLDENPDFDIREFDKKLREIREGYDELKQVSAHK